MLRNLKGSIALRLLMFPLFYLLHVQGSFCETLELLSQCLMQIFTLRVVVKSNLCPIELSQTG